MADTSEVTLAYTVDTNPDAALPEAVSPGNTAWRKINFVSHDLAPASDSVTSKVIRPDASVQDVRRTGSAPSGTLAMELARDAELEDLLAYALRGSWATNVLKAGVGKTAIALEEVVNELGTNLYTRYRGCRLGGFALETGVDGVVDIRFPISGTDIEVSGTALANSTSAAAGSAPVLAGIDFTAFSMSGLTTQLDLSGLTIDMTNNLRTDRKLGSGKARGVGYGKREAEIEVTAFFKDNDAFTQFKADTVTGVSFRFVAPGGTAGFQFDFGRTRIISFSKPIPGDNATIMVTMRMKATYNTGTSTDFQITRLV